MTALGSNKHVVNIADITATGELRVPLNLLAGKTGESMVQRRRRTHPKLHVS